MDRECDRLSSKVSRVTFFGQINFLQNFTGKNVHLEFWLDLEPNWGPISADDSSLVGLTPKCYSRGPITNVGCPFEFTVFHNANSSQGDHLLKSIKFCTRIVETHFFQRESTEAFGSILIPLKPGRRILKMDTFKPCSNKLRDKLVEEFLHYSFDLENLEKSHYKPVGFIQTESKGSISIELNVIIQSNKIFTELENNQLPKNNISHIVAAFKRARERLIWLKMKALNWT